MKRTILAGFLILLASAYLWAQRERVTSVSEPVRMEMRSVFRAK